MSGRTKTERERFLDRPTRSAHRSRLTLKGATVFVLWSHAHRPTRDLDFLGGGTFDIEEASAVVREIVDVPAKDGLAFDSASMAAEPIPETDEYHGVRGHLSATLDTVRIRMQIDIGVGDVVTPPAQEATLPAILDDFSAPKVRVSPAEAIVAEKLHAMVNLGIANSRMKDFFDVYLLASMREFDGELLAKAVSRTFRRRKTAIPEDAFALSDGFYDDRQKQTQWRAFRRKTSVRALEDSRAVSARLRTFLVPVMQSARSGPTAPLVWRSGVWRRPH